MNLEQEGKKQKLKEIAEFLRRFSEEAHKNPQKYFVDLEKDSDLGQVGEWVEIKIKVE